MKRAMKRLFFPILLYLLCADEGAKAQNFNPNILHSITSESATSRCIGNPRNPLCAVETYLACVIRRDHHLCDKIGYHGVYLGSAAGTMQYRILSYRTIRSADIPADLEGARGWRPGNVEITILDLRGIADICPHGCPYRFIAHPTLTHWELIGHKLLGPEDIFP